MASLMADEVEVTVRRLSGNVIGVVRVHPGMTTWTLKEAIECLGGPAPTEQQLVAGLEILVDDDSAYDAVAEEGSGTIFVVTVQGCPSCEGPCSCSLCNCEPQFGLIDYYGVCKGCTKAGGHSSKCPFCRQCFSSLCGLDTHIRFLHEVEYHGNEWNTKRLNAHIRKREAGNGVFPVMPEEGTFLEARCGGLLPADESTIEVAVATVS
eukprot:CAMPEP_0206463346 /NCGR_PEP_ID=MMETSP0324_2-20121206/26544_1 /ASSEMBLY_ACC=CAM_ASM_000836 /TAXON_ID=2866 /ORGANISM="Crypthecodinium cohnii, Strain Seligo" /LENGTH=207 /DNA_ID=CAMNT_0053935725 /DNA_START=163 /DNA_END=786 /DNA_ORIENTATION=+